MNARFAIHPDNTNSLISIIDEDKPNMPPEIEGLAVETGMPKFKLANHLRYNARITGLNRKIKALPRKKTYTQISTSPNDNEITTAADNFSETMISQADKVKSNIEKDIKSILEVDFDWEDSGLEKPSHQSLYFACDIIESLIDEVFSDEELATQWISPLHIYSNEAAYICLTWKCESRTLIFQIRHDVMKYRQAEINTNVSPKNIINKTGDLNTENSLAIWKWIINGAQTKSKK